MKPNTWRVGPTHNSNQNQKTQRPIGPTSGDGRFVRAGAHPPLSTSRSVEWLETSTTAENVPTGILGNAPIYRPPKLATAASRGKGSKARRRPAAGVSKPPTEVVKAKPRKPRKTRRPHRRTNYSPPPPVAPDARPDENVEAYLDRKDREGWGIHDEEEAGFDE